MIQRPQREAPPEDVEYPDGEVVFDARSPRSVAAAREALRRRFGLEPTLSSEPRGFVRRLRRLFGRGRERPDQRGGRQ